MTTGLLNPFWYAPAGDPNFASVGLLLHLDGTNGSTTITDSSNSHKTCVANLCSLTTSQQKFGTASLSSISSAYISISDSPDWLFGSGQFTVEAFVRPTAAVSGTVGVLTQWQASANLSWFFGFIGNTLIFNYSTTGANNVSISGSYTAPTNQWIHLAADRDASNVLRIYADGVVIASATAAVTLFDSTSILRVSNDSAGSRGFTGQIDEVRITKGVARYGGAFTPPSAPFPDA